MIFDGRTGFMVPITEVLPRSRAARAGICAGDRLLRINDKEIQDVLDYRFYLAERQITLLLWPTKN
jgi:NifB/MoaA-like Fe-S oxidoreductase